MLQRAGGFGVVRIAGEHTKRDAAIQFTVSQIEQSKKHSIKWLAHYGVDNYVETEGRAEESHGARELRRKKSWLWRLFTSCIHTLPNTSGNFPFNLSWSLLFLGSLVNLCHDLAQQLPCESEKRKAGFKLNLKNEGKMMRIYKVNYFIPSRHQVEHVLLMMQMSHDNPHIRRPFRENERTLRDRSLVYLKNIGLYIPLTESQSASRRRAMPQHFLRMKDVRVKNGKFLWNRTSAVQNEKEFQTPRFCYEILLNFRDLCHWTPNLHTSNVLASIISIKMSENEVFGVPVTRSFGNFSCFLHILTTWTDANYNRLVSENRLMPETEEKGDRVVMKTSFSICEDYLGELTNLLVLSEFILQDEVKVFEKDCAEVFHKATA